MAQLADVLDVLRVSAMGGASHDEARQGGVAGARTMPKVHGQRSPSGLKLPSSQHSKEKADANEWWERAEVTVDATLLCASKNDKLSLRIEYADDYDVMTMLD